jgi:hypothetical protein
MSEDQHSVDARLDAVLHAMREPPALAREAAARVAARAVLANAPMARSTAWSLRAAAALAILALGTAALTTVRARSVAPEIATAPQASPAATGSVGAAMVMPVIATTARPIVFEFDAPGARTVQVLGDFNRWSRDANSMQRGADGHWRMTTLLPPGRYVYAFLVNGQTFRRDPLRDAVEDRDFGVTGSELVVGEAP